MMKKLIFGVTGMLLLAGCSTGVTPSPQLTAQATPVTTMPISPDDGTPPAPSTPVLSPAPSCSISCQVHLDPTLVTPGSTPDFSISLEFSGGPGSGEYIPGPPNAYVYNPNHYHIMDIAGGEPSAYNLIFRFTFLNGVVSNLKPTLRFESLNGGNLATSFTSVYDSGLAYAKVWPTVSSLQGDRGVKVIATLGDKTHEAVVPLLIIRTR